MATNYPGSLDSGTQQPSPSSSTEMDDSGFEHDVVHTNHSGAIIALETKVGTGDSNAVASSVLAGTGSGTSGWSTAPSLAGLTVDTNTLHVDATNNRVGIGTTSPGEPLHIVTASSDAYLKQENGTATTFLGPDSSNTGLFGTSTAHDVRFITNNSERLRIDTSGDASMAGHLTAQSGGADSGIVLGQAFSTDYVGLRTAGMAEASGNEYVLISDGSITLLSGGTNGDVYIRGGANNSSCQIFLDTSENNIGLTGKVGIGNTSPDQTLHVNGVAALAAKTVTGQSTFTQEPWANSTIALGNFGSIGTQGSFRTSLAWNYERGTDTGWYSLGINSYGSAGGIDIGNDGILFRADATYGATAPPTTRMILTPAGDVGINDTSPSYKLDVNGTGRFTGELTLDGHLTGTSNTNFFVKNDSGEEILFQESSNQLFFKSNGTYRAYFMSSGHFRPYADNTYDIGTSGVRWDDIFATNGTIQTSDERDKTDVTPLNRGLAFIDELKPVSFRWSHRGDSGPLTRTHWGFLAQDVAATLGDAASASAVWTHSEASEEIDAEGATVQILDRQGLRMSELIAPVVKAIQELSTRVAALEAA